MRGPACRRRVDSGRNRPPRGSPNSCGRCVPPPATRRSGRWRGGRAGSRTRRCTRPPPGPGFPPGRPRASSSGPARPTRSSGGADGRTRSAPATVHGIRGWRCRAGRHRFPDRRRHPGHHGVERSPTPGPTPRRPTGPSCSDVPRTSSEEQSALRARTRRRTRTSRVRGGSGCRGSPPPRWSLVVAMVAVLGITVRGRSSPNDSGAAAATSAPSLSPSAVSVLGLVDPRRLEQVHRRRHHPRRHPGEGELTVRRRCGRSRTWERSPGTTASWRGPTPPLTPTVARCRTGWRSATHRPASR